MHLCLAATLLDHPARDLEVTLVARRECRRDRHIAVHVLLDGCNPDFH
jgi:hypothetical protein